MGNPSLRLSDVISYFQTTKTYAMGTQKNHLSEKDKRTASMRRFIWAPKTNV